MSSFYFLAFTYKRTSNGPPSTRIPHGRPKPLTTHRSSRSPPPDIRDCNLISLPFNHPHNPGLSANASNYVPVVTRCCPRGDFPRSSHPSSPEGAAVWDNPLHYLRSILLRGIFLGLLPFEPGPHPRTWRLLASHRYHHPGPV